MLPNWITRVLDAIGVGLSKPVDPLPPDAQKELERWDADDVRTYKERGGGIAPPDAPQIDPDGI